MLQRLFEWHTGLARRWISAGRTVTELAWANLGSLIAPPKLLLVFICYDGVLLQAAEFLEISRRFLMLKQMAVEREVGVHLVAKPGSVCGNYLDSG